MYDAINPTSEYPGAQGVDETSTATVVSLPEALPVEGLQTRLERPKGAVSCFVTIVFLSMIRWSPEYLITAIVCRHGTSSSPSLVAAASFHALLLIRGTGRYC